MSRTRALFFSPTGGTAKVATAVAAGIGLEVEAHDFTLPRGREDGVAFAAGDVAVIAAPVYAGRVPPLVAAHLAGIDGDGIPAVLLVVYGVRAYDDALIELYDICRGRGFACVAAGAFVAEHSYTPRVGAFRPDGADLDTARAFGVAARAKLASLSSLAGLAELEVPGDRPYREVPATPAMAPETSGACVLCGVCAKRCPVAAISFEDFSTVDPERCLRCSGCVRRCTRHAKAFTHPAYLQRVEMLEANFADVRREPELFI
jgi:ferredoxin